MKKALIAISASIALLLTGCSSSISQEEYDAKVSELETAQQELSDLQKEYDSTHKELTALQKEKAEKGISEAGAKSWVETAFGADAQAIINGNDLYVNIPTGYTVSEKSIEALWNTLYSGLSLYGKTYKANPEMLPYDSITIIVLEEETGLDMLSFQVLKSSDGSFTQNNSMISLSDFQQIAPYLNKALQ